MAQMLTAKQVAEVKGCSPRYIKKIIQDGKLKAVETVNSKNRKTYLVPLDALDEELQHKYYQLIAREFDTSKLKRILQSLETGLFFCQIFVFII